MKIRTWKFKLGPFTWTRRNTKPDTRVFRTGVIQDRHGWLPTVPGWYNVNGQAWYWTGSMWVRR